MSSAGVPHSNKWESGWNAESEHWAWNTGENWGYWWEIMRLVMALLRLTLFFPWELSNRFLLKPMQGLELCEITNHHLCAVLH